MDKEPSIFQIELEMGSDTTWAMQILSGYLFVLHVLNRYLDQQLSVKS